MPRSLHEDPPPAPDHPGADSEAAREVDAARGLDAAREVDAARGIDAARGLDAASEVDDFLIAFEAFARSVRRARGARAAAGPDVLTLSQYGLLEALIDRPEARVSELADCAGITPPTATRILDALERRGIVRRTPATIDRRVTSVTLTPYGRQLLGDQRDWIRSRQLALYADLAPEARAVARDLLHRLAVLTDELAAGPDQAG